MAESPSSVKTLVARDKAELDDLLKSEQELRAAVAAWTERGSACGADDSGTLQRISTLSGRLLQRNQAREAATRFGRALPLQGKHAEALELAVGGLVPVYVRQQTGVSEDSLSAVDTFLSKMYLHVLPGAAGAAVKDMALCARFQLTVAEATQTFDLELQVQHSI